MEAGKSRVSYRNILLLLILTLYVSVVPSCRCGIFTKEMGGSRDLGFDGMEDEMKITVDEKMGGTNVLLDGVLDFSASTEFKKLVQRLSSSRDRTLSFDLARVSRIDSVGLGLLHIAREELSDECRRVRLLSPQGGVLRMLELTEAGNDFDIVP